MMTKNKSNETNNEKREIGDDVKCIGKTYKLKKKKNYEIVLYSNLIKNHSIEWKSGIVSYQRRCVDQRNYGNLGTEE